MKKIKTNMNVPNWLEKTIKTVSIICFFFILFYVIWGTVLSPKIDLFRESAKVYDGEWVSENNTSSNIPKSTKMPVSLSLKNGETATFYTILPMGLEHGMYLTIHTGKSFSICINGEEVYSFNNTISRLPGNITKALIVPVPLKDEYSGQKLSITFTNDKYDRNPVNTAYIGSMMGIVTLYIKYYSIQFILALLLILASVVTIVIFAYIGNRDNKKAVLINLAEGILLICLWVVFDSPLFQLLFNKYFFDGIASFMLVTIMTFPFAVYFDEITEKRKHIVFLSCEAVMLINFTVFSFLHLSGLRTFDKSLVYLDVTLLVLIVIMLFSTISDYISQGRKSHKKVIRGLLGLGIFAFIEIIVTIATAYFPFSVDIGGLPVLCGMIFLLVFAILDQVGVYENLKFETQNALAATKAKSDFLANMSHEIRTPINAIMGMNEMVLRESNQEKIIEYAKDINSASENLLEIVNDILDFSKIESGKLEIICDNYDLGEIIYDVTTLVTMKAECKGLKLNVNVDEDLPSKLYGDDKRIREIITNILNNAVKYTETGFVNLKINGETQNENVLLNIRVEDSGQGIKPEDLDTIFDGFSQANVKKNKNIEGTGLGLSITKRLVELMNGTITVESEFGKGSVFTVLLPQRIVSDEKMGKYYNHRHSSKAEAVTSVEFDFTGVKILAVDDTALNLKVISKFLERTNAKVTCVSSGEAMLELIKENVFDIILLDHMMPNMDGIETLTLSKKQEKNLCINVPVIALTANAIVGAKEMYLEAGFDDYLSKPIKMPELCGMIEKYIK